MSNLPMSARAWATEIMTTLAHHGLLPAIHTNEGETVQDILTNILKRAMDQARFNPAPYENESQTAQINTERRLKGLEKLGFVEASAFARQKGKIMNSDHTE